MIGNDVIDLKLTRIESNWQRNGFIEKLFSEREQEIILNAEDSEVMVWNLWSRKEAAYKIYNRETNIRGFIPLQLQCFITTNQKDYVVCNHRKYYTKTTISIEKIETIAVKNQTDFENIIVLKDLIFVEKIKGIPINKNSEKPVTISHHGEFQQILTLK